MQIDSINNNNTSDTFYIDLVAKNLNIDLQDNSTQASLNGVDKFNTYNNPIIGIKLIYPQKWTVVEYRSLA